MIEAMFFIAGLLLGIFIGIKLGKKNGGGTNKQGPSNAGVRGIKEW